MTDMPTDDQLYELDRALLDEHGPSYINTICLFAAGMRVEGRTAEAQEALQQCDRMRAILMPDRELLAHYAATDGQPGEPGDRIADALCTEIHRRGLDV
jgi:hypothetical protein